MKNIEVSDEAYKVIMAHAYSNGESSIRAVDELIDCADSVWCMDMPELKTPWKTFKEYSRNMPAFEGME